MRYHEGKQTIGNERNSIETGGMMEQARLIVTPGGNGLLFQLSGSWMLQGGVPDIDEALQRLRAAGVVKLVTFDCAAVSGWDSGLLTWLLALAEYCKEHGIRVDSSGLPAGVDRLLALARAVPARKGAQRTEGKRSLLSDVGNDAIDALRITGEFMDFFGETILALLKMLRGRAVYRRSDLWQIMQDAGVRALPIVSLVSFLVGLILAYVGSIQLQNFGAGIYVADLVGIAMTREMAAIMTGIIMAGRTGASYAAELGSMNVNEEIDAFQTCGFSPMEFLVLPRMLALMLMMPLLAVYADLMGILGGAVVAVAVLDLTWLEYFIQLTKAVSLADFFVGICMAVVFGNIVAVIGCLNGIRCGRNSQAVGMATTSAVVSAIVMIVIASAVLTVIFDVLGI